MKNRKNGIKAHKVGIKTDRSKLKPKLFNKYFHKSPSIKFHNDPSSDCWDRCVVKTGGRTVRHSYSPQCTSPPQASERRNCRCWTAFRCSTAWKPQRFGQDLQFWSSAIYMWNHRQGLPLTIAISERHLTAEVRVRSQYSPRGIVRINW